MLRFLSLAPGAARDDAGPAEAPSCLGVPHADASANSSCGTLQPAFRSRLREASKQNAAAERMGTQRLVCRVQASSMARRHRPEAAEPCCAASEERPFCRTSVVICTGDSGSISIGRRLSSKSPCLSNAALAGQSGGSGCKPTAAPATVMLCCGARLLHTHRTRAPGTTPTGAMLVVISPTGSLAGCSAAQGRAWRVRSVLALARAHRCSVSRRSVPCERRSLPQGQRVRVRGSRAPCMVRALRHAPHGHSPPSARASLRAPAAAAAAAVFPAIG